MKIYFENMDTFLLRILTYIKLLIYSVARKEYPAYDESVLERLSKKIFLREL